MFCWPSCLLQRVIWTNPFRKAGPVMKKTVFTGSAVAIVTPMYLDGTVNYEELKKLVEFQIANGTDSIVACGTTGEASTLTDDEHLKVIRTVVETVKGRIPVIAGAGSNNTAHAVWLSKEAEKLGADALLHVTPYYNRTSQLGLIRHFSTIADAANLPVILYNVPSRTSVNILPETYQELSKHPNINAVKEANGNLSAAALTAFLCGENLVIYSGNDDQIVPFLSIGGKGVISVLANTAPKQTHDICQLYFDGKVSESAALQLKMMPLIGALFSEVNPVPVKEAINLMGFSAGACRQPLPPANENVRRKLLEAMYTAGIF